MRRNGWVALAVLLCPARVAFAADPPAAPSAQHKLVYESTLGARINPLGVEEQYTLALRERFYESKSLALRENYLAVGLSPTISPGVTRFGGHVEVRPVTVLSISAGFYQVGYFGSFGALQSFPNASYDYSDRRLTQLKDAGTNYPATGFEVQLRGVALGKIGPIVFRSDTNVFYDHLDLRKGDSVFYGPRMDLLQQNDGWIVTTEEDVAYFTDFGLIAGGRLSTGNTFVDAPRNSPSTMRLGPVAAYTFFDRPGTSFNKPTIAAICQWWLSHPYRTGRDISQGIPFVILAFRFEGELWRSK